MFYFYLFIIFFSIKMKRENVKIRLEYVCIWFSDDNDRLSYELHFFCEDVENEDEGEYMNFRSDDGQKWRKSVCKDDLYGHKLDHIFTDSMITKHFTEVKSKLVPKK